MTIGSILVGLAMLLLVAAFIARPFFETTAAAPQKTSLTRRQTRKTSLLAEKETLLQKIRELDFDHDTGKIPTEVYQPQRAAWVTQAAETLKQLDGAAPAKVATKAKPTIKQTTETDDIEAAVARLRARRAAKVQATAAQQPAAAAAAQPATNGMTAPTPAANAVRFCTQCSQAANNNDKFCAYCGSKLN